MLGVLYPIPQYPGGMLGVLYLCLSTREACWVCYSLLSVPWEACWVCYSLFFGRF